MEISIGSPTKCPLGSAGWYPSHSIFVEKRALYIPIPIYLELPRVLEERDSS